MKEENLTFHVCGRKRFGNETANQIFAAIALIAIFRKAFHHRHEKSKVIHKTHILFELEKNISLPGFLQECNSLICRRRITSRTCFIIKDWTVSYNWVINAALYSPVLLQNVRL